MQNPESGGIANQASDRNDAYHSVVSDLLSLIEHIQASRQLIEHAIAREASTGSQEGDIIVLDDVTPPFVTATAALSACDANLAIALDSLLDSTPTACQPGNRERICA
jgi:hypothetical protein